MKKLALHGGMLEKLVEASADGMVAYDRDGRILVWNAEMERMSGLPRDAVVGQLVFALFPFLEEHGDDDVLRNALAGAPGSVRGAIFSIPGTGRNGFYEADYFPARDEAGELVGAFGIIRDSTHAKQTEQRLHETEARFKNVADVAPVLLWMSNTEGMCTFFNQTWLDFTGRTLDEEWGVGWAEGVHFEDFQRCMDVFTDAFNRRESFEMEYRLRRSDGEFRNILDRGTPRYLPDGTFAGFIGSCADITEIKLLEHDLRKAVQVRDEFLSIASHELRTPLTALQLQLEIVRRSIDRQIDSESRSRSIRGAETALTKARHLDEMVGVLLDVSRLSREGMHLETSDVSLVSLVTEVVERSAVAAQKAGCEVRIGRMVDESGRWDRVRLAQVLTNILSNAIRYAPGSPIDVSARAGEGTVEIAVADQGPGIAPEHRDQLFERFTRFVASEHFGGLGLGLWISREIVRAHGGTIRVASDVGRGSTFVVELPTVLG